MKIIEKITLIIYSCLILILSVITLLTVFGAIDIDTLEKIIEVWIDGVKSSRIIIVVSVVFILLSIRCIFFDPTAKKEIKNKQGVLLANENGKLMISQDTIEDIVDTVTKRFENAKEVSSSVRMDKDNNINVNVNLVVTSDTVIKDLSTELQNRIKDKIKQTTDLEVKEVNITIKKAVPEKKDRKSSELKENNL